MRKYLILFIVAGLPAIFADCGFRGIRLSKAIPSGDRLRDAKVLSAFFGLDNALPAEAIRLHVRAPGKDGMPLVFSHELRPADLRPEYFRVITRSGRSLVPLHATFLPANEEFELRTVLLIGEMGDEPRDPPVRVMIVGPLHTRDGRSLTNQSMGVTALAAGPFVADAEFFRFRKDYPYRRSGAGRDCPRGETGTVVRLIWAGGVRAADGSEPGPRELANFKVRFRDIDGEIVPFQFGDLGDRDNNLDLCFRETLEPLMAMVAPGSVIDPRGDLNPAVRIRVRPRW